MQSLRTRYFRPPGNEKGPPMASLDR